MQQQHITYTRLKSSGNQWLSHAVTFRTILFFRLEKGIAEARPWTLEK